MGLNLHQFPKICRLLTELGIEFTFPSNYFLLPRKLNIIVDFDYTFFLVSNSKKLEIYCII